MKRILVLLLALVLLFCSCKGGARDFELTEDREGYLDKRSGLVYTQLESLYEAGAVGEVFAEYEDERGTVHQFFAVGEMPTDRFLCDEYDNVFVTGEDFVTADKWEISSVSVCQENVIAVVLRQYTAEEHADTVKTLRDLWFDAAAADFMPLSKPDVIYSVKLATGAYSDVLYSFSFYYFKGDGGYFYSSALDRSVKLPSELLTLFLAEGDL